MLRNKAYVATATHGEASGQRKIKHIGLSRTTIAETGQAF